MHRSYHHNHHSSYNHDQRAYRSRRHHTRSQNVYGTQDHVQYNANQGVTELTPEGPPPPYEEIDSGMPSTAMYQQPVASQERFEGPRSSRLRKKQSTWAVTEVEDRRPYAQERGWQSRMNLVTPNDVVGAPVARTMNQGAALCDRVAAAINDVVSTYFDQQEQRHYDDEDQDIARALEISRAEHEGSKSKDRICAEDFKKTWLYGNSRLLPHLPPSKIYLSTWQIICSAAQASMDVYRRPSSGERQDYIEADWRQGTKAMYIKSRPIDDKNLIVVAIRGTKWNLVDWAVNFRPAPTPPDGFLDDDGNACHAGFLEVARAMIAPIAARLREIIQQNPSRASSSLVITGHSAGGAVASLLYMHMMSQTISSELTDLTGIFKRVHCIVFGTPPLSFLPLQMPPGSKNLFMHFVNEGDLVVRADKEYLGTLARIITAPAPIVSAGRQHGIRQQFSRQTLKTTNKVVNRVIPPRCEVPHATLSIPGKIVLLRESPVTRERIVEAVQVADEHLRQVVFGDLEMHSMVLYKERVNELACAAVTGRGVG